MNKLLDKMKRNLWGDEEDIAVVNMVSKIQYTSEITKEKNLSIISEYDSLVFIHSDVIIGDKLQKFVIIMRVLDAKVVGIIVSSFTAYNKSDYVVILKSIVDTITEIELERTGAFVQAKSPSDMKLFSELETPVYMINAPIGFKEDTYKLDKNVFSIAWGISVGGILQEFISEKPGRNLDNALPELIKLIEQDITALERNPDTSMFGTFLDDIIEEYEMIVERKVNRVKTKGMKDQFGKSLKDVIMSYNYDEGLGEIQSHPGFSVQDALIHAAFGGGVELFVELNEELDGDILDPEIMTNAIMGDNLPIVSMLAEEGSPISINVLKDYIKNGGVDILNYALSTRRVDAKYIKNLAITAATNGNLEALTSINSSGFELKDILTELINYSVSYGHLNILKYYVEKEGFTDVFPIANNALKQLKIPMIKYLLNVGLDAKYLDSNAYISMLQAPDSNVLELVQLLYSKGYNIIQDGAADASFEYDDFETADYLISMGARLSPNLSIAEQIEDGDAKKAFYLFKRGYPFDPNQVEQFAEVIFNDGEINNIEIIPLLGDKGLLTQNIVSMALYKMILYNELEKVKYLVSGGANVSLDNNKAIIMAARYGFWDIVQYLISQGADINARDGYLMKRAVALKFDEQVEMLKSLGAYPATPDDDTLYEEDDEEYY